ncbi:MAG TPA: Kazal-type serine protease inhibitor [Polyangiaceae bacterium]
MRSLFAVLLANVLATTVACGTADLEEGDSEASHDARLSSEEGAIELGCTKNDDCRVGSYCKLSACSAPGICAPRPAVCTTEVAPVCGCDGKTYTSACVAARAGVSVKHNGRCIKVQ